MLRINPTTGETEDDGSGLDIDHGPAAPPGALAARLAGTLPPETAPAPLPVEAPPAPPPIAPGALRFNFAAGAPVVDPATGQPLRINPTTGETEDALRFDFSPKANPGTPPPVPGTTTRPAGPLGGPILTDGLPPQSPITPPAPGLAAPMRHAGGGGGGGGPGALASDQKEDQKDLADAFEAKNRVAQDQKKIDDDNAKATLDSRNEQNNANANAVAEQARIKEDAQKHIDALQSKADAEIEKKKQMPLTDMWADKSNGDKAIGAIAIALGALGASLSHGPNYAQQIIDRAVARDIHPAPADSESTPAPSSRGQRAP